MGPNALGIVKDMEGVKLLGELGVVFLLFNIGLELSLERLRSMAKLVFGLGTAQVLVTISSVALTMCLLKGVSGPAAIVVGCALALSSTAVGMQVCPICCLLLCSVFDVTPFWKDAILRFLMSHF